MLTGNDLAEMRSAIAQLLPALCDILSVTRTSDGQGGQVDTWGTVTASVPCRLDYNSGNKGREQIFGNALQPYVGWILSVPYDTTITQANRVQIGVIVYNVTMADIGKSWNAVRRCALEEI